MANEIAKRRPYAGTASVPVTARELVVRARVTAARAVVPPRSTRVPVVAAASPGRRA